MQPYGLALDDARTILLHSMAQRTHLVRVLRESAVWCCEAQLGTACYSSWLIELLSAVWKGHPAPMPDCRSKSMWADWLPWFPGTSGLAGSGRGMRRDCCCCCWMKCDCIGDEQVRRWQFLFLRRLVCCSGVACESTGWRTTV